MTDFKADIESRARTSTVRFSLVSFGTNVDDTIALGDDLQKTITDTNKIVYSGGWTNTEQAIAQCDQTLNSVGFSSLRYILLFTDGAPTVFGTNTGSSRTQTRMRRRVAGVRQSSQIYRASTLAGTLRRRDVHQSLNAI